MLGHVGRKPLVPPALTRGPFTLEDARRAGLARWHLEGVSWGRLGPETYIWAGLGDSPERSLEAASRRLPPGASKASQLISEAQFLIANCP